MISAAPRLLPHLLGLGPLPLGLQPLPLLRARDPRGLSGRIAVVQCLELLPQPCQRPPSVLKLASLRTALATHTTRPVNQPHPGICGVLVLSALSAGPERLNPALGEQIPIVFGNHDGRRRGCLISHGTGYARIQAEDVWSLHKVLSTMDMSPRTLPLPGG